MWEFVRAGGWLMLPLVICSIITVAIIIERLLRLQRKNIIPPHTLNQLLAAHQQQIEPAPALFQSPLGQILYQGYRFQNRPPQFAQLHMQTEASVQIATLERHINFLGTIGSIAPLLGLLGTVLGIIQAFLAVNAGGVTDPAMLAGGVSKALITTAAGMVVAIPALVAYRYFQRVVVDLVVILEQQATRYHASLFYDEVDVLQSHHHKAHETSQ